MTQRFVSFLLVFNKYLPLLLLIAVVFLTGLTIYALHGSSFAVLNPKGVVALKERNLMLLATLLMSLVVVPVLGLTFWIAWRYRKENRRASYTPNWDHSLIFESVWWGIPCVIIFGLAVISWTSSHALDPAKALASAKSPITVQVVALPWKWLFIYPAQGIATVNYVEFPENTPINFQITADAPMNSFWIPQLGSQIYAMPGMTTSVKLMADHAGVFHGDSANLSGAGFASMQFRALSVSAAEFDRWTSASKQASTSLDGQTYAGLVKPSEHLPEGTYRLGDAHLFEKAVESYMSPAMGSMSMP